MHVSSAYRFPLLHLYSSYGSEWENLLIYQDGMYSGIRKIIVTSATLSRFHESTMIKTSHSSFLKRDNMSVLRSILITIFFRKGKLMARKV